MLRTILRLMGKDENDFEHVIDRPGHDMRYAIDGTRLREELGWDRSSPTLRRVLPIPSRGIPITVPGGNRSRQKFEAKYAKAGQ